MLIIGFIFLTIVGLIFMLLLLILLGHVVECVCDTYKLESPIKTLLSKVLKPKTSTRY